MRWVMKRSSSTPIATASSAIDASATSANQRVRLKCAGWALDVIADLGMRGAVGSGSFIDAPCKFRDLLPPAL